MTISHVRFYSSIIISIQTKTPAKRGISSSNFVLSGLKLHEEPTLHHFLMRKYWINLSENWFVNCLDICLDLREISKDLDY